MLILARIDLIAFSDFFVGPSPVKSSVSRTAGSLSLRLGSPRGLVLLHKVDASCRLAVSLSLLDRSSAESCSIRFNHAMFGPIYSAASRAQAAVTDNIRIKINPR